ncbi:MAG: preprotein translocase subunit YajC [Pseudomonadota bacterium]
MLISPAYAQSTGGGAFDMVALLPLVLIFVIFYFLVLRPQQQKMKFHRAMVEAVRRGDRIVTQGGIIGTVTKVTGDREMTVEIAEGVRVRVLRAMVAEVMAKPEPAEAKEAKKAEAERAEPETDYYKILGVKKNATAAEIAAAGAAKTGPDATDAYETLKDPIRRKLYDSLGHEDYVMRVKG